MRKIKKSPKVNEKDVKENTVIAKNYATKKCKTQGNNVAWNEALLESVKT